jgi:mono/diheme cytochrome c family protein
VALFSFLLVLTAAGSGDDAARVLYDKACVKCHGEDGKGETKIGKLTKTPDLNQRPWKRGEMLEDMLKLITEGEGKMPREKKLSTDEISAVAQYTLDLFKKE